MMSPMLMNGFNGVVGAKLTPVDDGWRELVGVNKRLVVVGVAAGSPAQCSGLVKLQVVRKGKPLAITLSWQ